MKNKNNDNHPWKQALTPRQATAERQRRKELQLIKERERLNAIQK